MAVTTRKRSRPLVGPDDLIETANLAGMLRRLAVRMVQRATTEDWDTLDFREQERRIGLQCQALASYYPEIETQLRHLMGVEDGDCDQSRVGAFVQPPTAYRHRRADAHPAQHAEVSTRATGA